jgi:hypothetical protein
MRVNDFLHLVAQEARPRLPLKLRGFQTRTRFTLIQLYYTRRTLHYEVWVRGKERLLEIGLHFEADKATNAALFEYFAARAFEIKDTLGDHVDIEQWTSSWSRVHQLMPYERLDAATATAAAQRLAKMMETLQSMVERAMPRANPKTRP